MNAATGSRRQAGGNAASPPPECRWCSLVRSNVPVPAVPTPAHEMVLPDHCARARGTGGISRTSFQREVASSTPGGGGCHLRAYLGRDVPGSGTRSFVEGTAVHIVIMGCGRVGSTLAHILEDRDNAVSVIDRDPEAFRRLGSGFKGDRVTGMGFDRAVLTQAGIERADAFAAVSSGDNSNIIAARVARETFGVQRERV